MITSPTPALSLDLTPTPNKCALQLSLHNTQHSAMAFVAPFIAPFAPSVASHTTVRHRILLRNAPTQLTRAAHVPRWTMTNAHPYGNGGLINEPDWTGFDPDALDAELADAKERMRTEHREHNGPWAIVLNADIIQWNNNLFNASRAAGFSWDLNGIRIVRLSAITAKRDIEDVNPDLFNIDVDGKPYTFFTGTMYGMLAFTGQDEANRFAEMLRAEGKHPVCVEKHPTTILRDTCHNNSILLGVVPMRTLISPDMLERVGAPSL